MEYGRRQFALPADPRYRRPHRDVLQLVALAHSGMEPGDHVFDGPTEDGRQGKNARRNHQYTRHRLRSSNCFQLGASVLELWSQANTSLNEPVSEPVCRGYVPEQRPLVPPQMGEGDSRFAGVQGEGVVPVAVGHLRVKHVFHEWVHPRSVPATQMGEQPLAGKQELAEAGVVGPVPSGKPQSLGCVSVAELGVASGRECRVAHWGVPVDDRVEGVPGWSVQVPRTEIPGADRPFPVQEAESVGRQIEALPYD